MGTHLELNETFGPPVEHLGSVCSLDLGGNCRVQLLDTSAGRRNPPEM